MPARGAIGGTSVGYLRDIDLRDIDLRDMDLRDMDLRDIDLRDDCGDIEGWAN
jgi:hypothetical protein